MPGVLIADDFVVRVYGINDEIWVDVGQFLAQAFFEPWGISGGPDYDIAQEMRRNFAHRERRIVILNGLRFGRPKHRANRLPESQVM